MTCESGIFITPLKIKQYCTTHAHRFEYYSKNITVNHFQPALNVIYRKPLLKMSEKILVNV